MTTEHDEIDAGHQPSRRIVFTGLASLGVAVALAGCGSSSDSGSAGSSSDDSAGSGSSDSASASPSATASSSGSGSGGAELAKTSDVPVNGGVILTDKKIVITQPTAGEFKAFSAVCTHQGFTVTSVSNGKIDCNHHGSEYDAATGKVDRGPAPKALASVAITVQGDSILAA